MSAVGTRMVHDEPAVHIGVTFAVLTGSVAAYALLQSLVIPVLPTIQQSLHTSQESVTWVLTVYLLSASIFTPIMGRVGDIRGKKPTLVVALAALAAGSLVAAVAPDLAIMIVARAIQGIGGGVLPLAFGIIRDEFPEDRVSSAVGSLASLTAVGGGLGIVLAGPIDHSLGVHWLFWVPTILVGTAAVVAFRVVPDSPVRSPGRISTLPALLLSAWLTCGLIALSESTTWGWVDARTAGLLAAAAVFAVAWVYSETRAVAPLIDMRMMRLPAVWTTNLVALLVGVGMYSAFAFLPQFVQTPRSAGYGFGASITASGLMLLPSTVTMFVVGQYCGRLVRAVGSKLVIVIGCVAAMASMIVFAAAHHHTWQIYVGSALLGVGFGLAFSAMSSLIVDAVPRDQTGVASGMNANIRTIGGSIGAALMASVVTAGTHVGDLPHQSGYTNGFAMLAVAMALASAAALLIPRLSHRDDPDEPPHAALAIVAGGTLVGDKPE
jgi:MFS family permease